MFFDILFAILIITGAIKGWRQGFIVSAFSVLAIFIGLAAAIKFSSVVANKLIDSGLHIANQWLPVISFAIVFIVVIIAVRWLSKIIQKIAKFAFLGLINNIAGALLYITFYSIVVSVILFYLQKLNFIQTSTIQHSVLLKYFQNLGPTVMNYLGNFFPWFQNMFKNLENYFEQASQKIK